MNRKTEKLFFAALMTVLITVLSVFCMSACALNEGDFVYEYTDAQENEIIITDCVPTLKGDVVLPSVIDGKPVVAIGPRAFYYCHSITSIIIPDTVREIGEYAFFYCGGLGMVQIPESVTHISDYAFYLCPNLTTVYMDKGVKTIGNYAFAMCQTLRNVIVPDGIESVGKNAFYGCCSVENIYIGSTVRTIGMNAFKDCNSVQKVYYGGTKQEWEKIDIQYDASDTNKGNETLINAEKVYSHAHSYNDTVITRKATCKDEGIKTHYCQCGNSTYEYYKGSHEYADKITKATNKSDGKIVTYCIYCSKQVAVKYIPKASAISLSATSYIYDGKSRAPTVTVKTSKGVALVLNTDYKVAYASGRKNIGKYAVKVTFCGEKYTGSVMLYFTINPQKTANVTVAQSTSAVKLTWSKVSGATGYRIYSYNTTKKTYTTLATLSGTTYTVKNLKAGTAYVFVVKAYTKLPEGDVLWGPNYNVTTATKPTTPTLKAAAAGGGKASLSWNKQTGTGYVIYMATSAKGTYTRVGVVQGASNLKFTKSGLKKGTTYYFKIAAYKTAGGKNVYSSWSNVKSVCIK
ncbi:MAG: leucine-rich repeat protein [Oscillospiraceae bacterium]|nr:leucine-rich repeat protein [Oscillospiraceae bacterium]